MAARPDAAFEDAYVWAFDIHVKDQKLFCNEVMTSVENIVFLLLLW